jgi:Hint domain/Passenger-associated-transport-repeat
MPTFVNPVTTESQLDNDIQIIDGTTVANTYTITLGANVTETFDLSAINLHNNVSLVINGAGFTLSGSSAFSGLLDFNGALTVNNLTISNMLAQGGVGGNSGGYAGGGGAGLGGGLFVAGTNVVSGTTFSGGTVTLNAVTFSGDTAKGGAGGNSKNDLSDGYAGGGGMGGAGGYGYGVTFGGGGGIGSGATGGDSGTHTGGAGIVVGGSSGGSGNNFNLPSNAGGTNGGGGGSGSGDGGLGSGYGGGSGGGGLGGANGQSKYSTSSPPGKFGAGGAGGFGGGGGGAYIYGGHGGFGGGGGSGYTTSGYGGFGGGGAGGYKTAGAAGFGAGKGGARGGGAADGAGGGGGLGAGGDVFVQQGGTLIIGSGSLAAGAVIAGAAGTATNAGTAGSAFGNGIFIENTSTTVTQFVSLSPAAGNTLTIGGQIADQAGSLNQAGDSSATATEGGLVVTGGGKVVLQSTTALDNYTGGTKLQGGTTLDLNAGTAAGTGAVTFGTGFGDLQIQSAAMTGSSFANTIAGIVAGDVIDLASLSFHAGASATVSGSTLKVISNSATQTLTVSGSPSGFSVVQDAGTGSDVIINTFTVTSLSDLINDLAAINVGGIDSFSGNTYTFDFTSAFALPSTQTIDLGTGSKLSLTGTGFTTGGGYDVVAGTLAAGATGAIGTGNVTLGSGTSLNLGTFNQTIGDLSGSGAISLGSGTLTEGTSNSTLFSGVLNGASGDFVKQGSGTLSLTGSGSSLSVTTINAGIVQLGTGGAGGSLSGSIVDNALLAIDESIVTTLSNTISGTGGLLQSGSGTTVLTGTDTYNGATTIQAGGLQIGNGSTVGSIANTSSVSGSGTLSFDRSDSNVFAPVITGSVLVVQAGSGSTALTGTDSYTGGTTIQAGTLQIGNGGATGAISGNIVDNATLAVDETGTVTIAGTISGSGAVVQAGSGTTILNATNVFGGGLTLNGGKVVLGSAGAAGGGTITFGSGTFFAFNGTAVPLNVVSGMVQTTDTIDVTNVVVSSATLVNTNTIQINRTVGGPIDVTLNPGQSYAGLFAHSATSGTDNFITLSTVPCFLRGTRILTEHGEVPVESLSVGDRVVTLSGNTQAITWIGTGRVLATRGRRNAATPVIVKKSALAPNVPARDLRITKGHALLIDDVLIPVEELVNHRSILWDDRAQEVLIYHVELATHDVLLADGAPAESYRDDGNRWLFQNANTGWHQPPKPPCAAVLNTGPIVDAAWRRLLDRAGPRPGLPLTDDPDLHLLMNGHRLDAIARHDGVHVFRLAHPPQHLRIKSRCGIPQELGTARDPRSLGVALRRIMLRQNARARLLTADDATLRDGFHDFEPDNGFRWTEGDAAIPAALFAGATGRLMLELHVGATAHYVAEDEARVVA